ncbi:protein disulfide-isomerase [Saitozyma sp. JCM 24511]|nr:protein disulfide-isomerase [Saitozyma sp. JCM 24511]
MRLSLSLSAAVLGLASLVRASNVIDLDTKNFDKIVGGSKGGSLVELWCGHCKNLAPTYEQLADAFPSDKVVIAKTDADGVGRELGSRYGVTGFPTLKWFPAGSTEAVDYTGGRDLDSLAAFVTEKSGVKSKIKPPPPPAAVQLDSSNFADIALDESKNVLVAFTAPWCGHCKNMKPAYENVARAFLPETDCVVAQMNADDEENKPIASEYGVRSFPTIKFFPKGADKEPVVYSSGRSEEQFIEFLNEHCGTHRSASGLLTETAGKVLPLDKLASNFFTASLPERPAILDEAKKYLASLSGVEKKVKDSAAYYVRAMERIVEKGEAWLTKEQARIAGLLASPSLAPTKLDELKIKANILSSFAVQKITDLYEAAEEAVEGAGQVVYEAAQDAGHKIKAEL